VRLRNSLHLGLPLLLVVLLAIAAGCGDDENSGGGSGGSGDSGSLSGSIDVDGSSTVGPMVTYAAELFQEDNPDVQATVGISGTGGGFERFCAGETDLSNASRPIKTAPEDEEATVCEQNGIEYTEFQVANDGISIVVNKENDWVDCLTVDQLNKMWADGSTVDNWNQVDPSFPDEELKLFGPGTDSGTFDFFTDQINGEEGVSRSDYTASEDDNVLVQGVEGEKGGLAYFGYSYYEENADQLKLVSVDGGDGCVAPSVETVQDGTYTPLSRPLFIYVNNESFKEPQVDAFLKFILDNESSINDSVGFVPLTDDQLSESQSEYDTLSGSS
jgi:phosphate transport system substrate-binding protein